MNLSSEMNRNKNWIIVTAETGLYYFLFRINGFKIVGLLREVHIGTDHITLFDKSLIFLITSEVYYYILVSVITLIQNFVCSRYYDTH